MRDVEKKPKVQSSASLVEIIKYVQGWDFLIFFIGTLGSIVAATGWPALTVTFGETVDVFVSYESWFHNQTNSSGEDFDLGRSKFMQEVIRLSLETGVVCLAYTIGMIVAFYSFQIFSSRLTNRVKIYYFRSILKQEMSWFDRQSSGEFASRISSDFKKFENAFNQNFGLLVYDIASSLFHLILGLWYGWELSLVTLSLSPLMIIAAIISTKLQSYYGHKELEAYSAASSVAEEAISAIRTVYAFGGQQKEMEHYESKLVPAMQYGCKRNLVTGLGVGFHWTTIYLGMAVGLWYGIKLNIDPNHDYSVGRVVIVFWAITGCSWCIGYAAPFYESLQIGKTAARSIIDVIKRESLIDTSEEMVGKKLEDGFRTQIEFRDVHFSYPLRPDTPILQGLNLKINPGEIVALVGSSGCGKSTTIQLIQRFYDVNNGKILLDNYELPQLNIGWLRGQLGVVGQEPVLFDLSIEENIRLGAPADQIDQITMNDIEKAAKEANAHDFIVKLPQSYKTYVGDRGAQLSGGQKQRIAIARALIGDPKILLLDEATSALDLESENIVQAALNRASQNRTTIIIAHRLSTITHADRIVYIHKGQVVEEGTHQSLMKLQGRYYELVQAQQVISKSEHQKAKNETSVVPEITKVMEVRRSNTGTFSSDISLKLSNQNDDDPTDEISSEDLKQSKNFPIKRLFELIWQESKFCFMIAFLCALIYGTCTPIYALIFGEFVQVFTTGEIIILKETMIYTYSFVALAFGILVFCATQITLFGIVGERLTKRLRTMAYNAILNQEIPFFDEQANSAGALCARLANDAANVQGVTGLRISMICQAVSTVLFSVIMGLYYNWQLALVSFCLMPLIAFTTSISSSADSKQAGKDSGAAEKCSKTIIEVVNSIRTVVSLHKEQYFYEKINSLLAEHYLSIRMKLLLRSIMIGLSMGTPMFAYTVSFYYGGWLISYGSLRSGDFFKIIESVIFGALVIGQSSAFTSDFTKAKIAANNIFKLIDRGSMLKSVYSYSMTPNKGGDGIMMIDMNNNNRSDQNGESANGKSDRSSKYNQNEKIQNRSKGNVSFYGVRFSYPSRPDSQILKGLSFSARQGETVALVGSSGCGKSTSIQLLERFYDCSQGQVNLDGNDITQLDVGWLRSQMSLVSQEPILFSYSIRDNIAYGDNSRQVPIEEIKQAARMANIDDFINQLPQKYDTPVGGKGSQLSGGQKQRIAIARALIRDPPILLLDEATSALDTESEQIVQAALDQAAKDRTCLVIAHRLKTIVNSDRIVVIDRGQNVEEGTHEELLARRGHYWHLYKNSLG